MGPLKLEPGRRECLRESFAMTGATRLRLAALVVLTACGFLTVIVLTSLQREPSGIGLWLLVAWVLALLVILLALEGTKRSGREAWRRK